MNPSQLGRNQRAQGNRAPEPLQAREEGHTLGPVTRLGAQPARTHSRGPASSLCPRTQAVQPLTFCRRSISCCFALRTASACSCSNSSCCRRSAASRMCCGGQGEVRRPCRERCLCAVLCKPPAPLPRALSEGGGANGGSPGSNKAPTSCSCYILNAMSI